MVIKDFEYQFRQLYRPLNLFAMRIVDNSDDCEDIVQQAFTDVWEKMSGGVVIDDLRSYLYRAVRNRCLNYRSSINSLSFDDSTVVLPDLSEDEQELLAERDARLWTAIDNLPEERRKILLMAKKDGMRYQEIADELHISVKTVENQMGKALKSLRAVAYRIYLFFFG